MRLLASDPDIETLIGRIEKEEIDLQPDFQRGEVWPQSKRQRLIDSVLRDWHVPPIHVIQNEDHTVAVLDGQQRLAAIRDFVAGEFLVDGDLSPYDEKISAIDGLSFLDLPSDYQRRFLRFSIRLFTIVDYKPAEPGELFYRLNQLSSLTSAEQRNAFFGETRKQVKSLVELVDGLGIGGNLLGFSNARMAYDDVIARSLFLLDAGTLRKKITSNALADRYRTDALFSESAVTGVKSALELMSVSQKVARGAIRLNKATAQTWIVFLASAPRSCEFFGKKKSVLAEFMARFELMRSSADEDVYSFATQNVRVNEVYRNDFTLRRALYEYEDRATSRVADISSVVIRDLVLWIFFISLNPPENSIIYDWKRRQLYDYLSNDSGIDYPIDMLAESLDWGDNL